MYCGSGDPRIKTMILTDKNESLKKNIYRLLLPRELTRDLSFTLGSIEETFKYLGSLLTNQNSTQEEIKCRLKVGNSCYYSVQTPLSSRVLSKNLKIKI